MSERIGLACLFSPEVCKLIQPQRYFLKRVVSCEPFHKVTPLCFSRWELTTVEKRLAGDTPFCRYKTVQTDQQDVKKLKLLMSSCSLPPRTNAFMVAGFCLI